MISAKTVVARYRIDRGENLRDQYAPFGTVGVLEDLDGPKPALPRGAMDHATQDAKRKYLQEHPDADKSNQRVKPGIHSEK